MDFTQIGFDEVWENEAKAHRMANAAKWHAGIFAWFGINLVISIIRTISTSPGTIPEHREWDMNSESDCIEQEEDLKPLTKFSNSTIDKHMYKPEALAHEDYKYLVTKAGPIVPS